MNLSNVTKAHFCDRERSIDSKRHHNDSTLSFGDVRSSDFNLYFTGIRISDSPQRDVSLLAVPGRNGDLIVDNHRWKNIDITYSFAMATHFSDTFDAFKAALLSQDGYQKLSDSIYPDVFRMAIVKEAIQPETMRYNRTGKFDVTFHCKPQRYLVSGTVAVILPVQFLNLYNAQGFPAKPLITVYGTGEGTLTVGNTTVEITDIRDQLILDCDLQTAYRQTGDSAPESMNGNIYAPDFPELVKGSNIISWTGGVTKVEIIPRWWTL